MSRTLTASALRLSADPAPAEERLHAAEAVIAQAAQAGAKLIVLPELFNAGYVYDDSNYSRAKSIDGPTVSWMKRIAAERDVHLAGSILLLGPEDITNSLLLVAPDGRLWRYDKNYPWVWERLYFREGRGITVAHTDIGTFGLMICADGFAPDLYKRYAGKVDAMIISASPPRMHEAMFTFPDGGRISFASLWNMNDDLLAATNKSFGQHVLRNTAWMGVPVIQSVPYGHFSTPIPLPLLSMLVLVGRKPALWRYILQGRRGKITARYFGDNQIADASGKVLARYDAEADGCALATIELADEPPKPNGKQPPSKLLPADIFNEVFIPFYRRGIQRTWGQSMAPLDRQTLIWLRWLVGATLGGITAGYGFGHFNRKRTAFHS